MRPWRSTVAATSPAMSSLDVTSPVTASRSSPWDSRSAASPASWRSNATTVAPAAENRPVAERPIPLAAPVMTATLPCRSGRRPVAASASKERMGGAYQGRPAPPSRRPAAGWRIYTLTGSEPTPSCLGGHLRALQPGGDLLHRDVAGEVRRAVLGLDVAAERREAAVVGRAEPLDRDVAWPPQQLVADVLGRLDARVERVDHADEAHLRHAVGVLAAVAGRTAGRRSRGPSSLAHWMRK